MRRILTILMFVSLIPALLIAWQRIRAEQGNKVVAIVMDYPSLKAQAGLLGKPTQALLAHYQKEGVNGVGVYEDSVQSRILEGKAAYASGSSLLAKHPGAAVHPSWTYLRSLAPGTVAQLRSRYRSPSQVLQIGKQRWTGWPVDIRGLPAGAPMRLLRSLHRRGLLVVYRPFYSSLERHLGRLLPPAHLAPFLAFLGSSVPGAGNHQLLAAYSQKLSGRTLAPIGFNAQTGMLSLASQHPAVQLFSLPSNYLATLSPQSASLKYVLGAANRSYRLLYLHPYTSVKSTDLLIRSVVAGLKAHGFTIGTPQPVSFVPNHTLQRLSLIGPLLALVLLALSYRLRWLGVAVAVLVVLLAVADAGHTLAGGALMAGLTFPVLGLVNRRERPVDWLTATLYTLSGAMFAQAMGVSRLGMLALSPYRGVALVLTVPALLFLFSLIPNQDLRVTLRQFYSVRLRLGDLILFLVVIASMALVLLRRGNNTGLGASRLELKVRSLLQHHMVRPRFKELIGHPLALIGLDGPFVGWVNAILLAGGVVGQSSIMDSFGQYNTPLLTSLDRTFNGLWIGGLIGLILIPILRGIAGWFRAEPAGAEVAAG